MSLTYKKFMAVENVRAQKRPGGVPDVELLESLVNAREWARSIAVAHESKFWNPRFGKVKPLPRELKWINAKNPNIEKIDPVFFSNDRHQVGNHARRSLERVAAAHYRRAIHEEYKALKASESL